MIFEPVTDPSYLKHPGSDESEPIHNPFETLDFNESVRCQREEVKGRSHSSIRDLVLSHESPPGSEATGTEFALRQTNLCPSRSFPRIISLKFIYVLMSLLSSAENKVMKDDDSHEYPSPARESVSSPIRVRYPDPSRTASEEKKKFKC
ncbi:hypothetical protein NPIL_91821 [Nephila pilipes]|uniref:Uncharacterized protein n=1 Tax=Nephila pilipes TaxID=299642 RepID=A0A8X6NY57_NEPPI|nr:hypothetical protein NPIL_91821 [Nephila pilipes]